ncbi:MAG: hypothetical protein IH589_14085 [Anaerolineales bacterium]|nr:hypothetical protein [Anaerolineales bacterium]
MEKRTEEQRAKSAYTWLRVSPLVTLGTLILIAGYNLPSNLCAKLTGLCQYNIFTHLDIIGGILISALWHLNLLRFVNDPESKFVRRHGKKALTFAGIRTAIALGAVLLDYFAGVNGVFSFFAVALLVMLWGGNTKIGLEEIEKELRLFSSNTAPQPVELPIPEPSNLVILEEYAMSENDPHTPEEILNEIYLNLQSDDDVTVLQAISTLATINFSSEAVWRRLEILSVQSDNKDIRKDALAALSLPAQRNVRSRLNKLQRSDRMNLLHEIGDWVNSGLLASENAEVLRRRYDFDLAPPPAPTVAPVRAAAPQPEANVPAEGTQTAPPLKRSEPEGPRPTLLQTLVSEASIKIYLYLGAFFVIASAAIVGAAVPELRLPILIVSTLIFGGLSIAIKKRLPQPSFALFIVFSFLLPITANTIEETIGLSARFSAGYWVFVYLVMALIWSGSTWFYESRLFSITAFASLALAFVRMGDVFNAEAEFYTSASGLAALAGLAGVWLLKKWKDAKFALPLFLSAQFLQAVVLAVSISAFGVHVFDPSYASLWHLGSFFTWALAFGFYIFSNSLNPFLFFPWLAAGTLIPMPWFLAAAFDLESLGSTFVLFVWGALLSVISEFAHRFELTRKYGLPFLLAAMPTFAIAIITGFSYNTALGMAAAFGIAILYAALHLLRIRWWLWTLALLNFIIGYFAFFNLDFIQKLNIFFGYQLLLISILFLLPDLFLKKDLKVNLEWRLPPRIYGALFAFYTSAALLFQNESNHAAICFAIYTLFFAAYAYRYHRAILGYIPAAYLPLAILFALDFLELDLWLPSLTALAVLYFVVGIAIRSKEEWAIMFRNCALTLGTIISFIALLLLKEFGGWYALVIGLLFITEMYFSRSGWFEIGAPALFNIGMFLILRDFNVDEPAYHLLAYSLVWLIADLLAHLTFANTRPLAWIVRGVGALLAITNYGFLFAESDTTITVIGFGIYTLLFLTISLLYRQPNLFYAFTLSLPLFVTFLFREFDVTKWIHPVIILAVLYYAAGYFLRAKKNAPGWDLSLLNSGLGLGVFVSLAAPALGGLDAAIPVAIAATLWAVEAFAKKNAWLAFPANGLYLLAYFIILFELNVSEPQFFSMGAALLGLIQHYLLVRAESKAGAFIMGMVSQFVLLGTTYIEMLNKNDLIFTYFLVLFFQSLAVLAYGIVIRSRSLTFFPIGFVVLGVLTVVINALEGAAIFVIGCTGILLLMFGVLAVLLRERISKLSEKIGEWKA